MSYRSGLRFKGNLIFSTLNSKPKLFKFHSSNSKIKENSNGIPGPGSYTPAPNLNSSFEKKTGGKWGLENKRGMEIRSSVGKYSLS